MTLDADEFIRRFLLLSKGSRSRAGKDVPAGTDGGGEIVRFFASSQSERLRLQH
jgi:hypothetical protein